MFNCDFDDLINSRIAQLKTEGLNDDEISSIIAQEVLNSLFQPIDESEE